MANWDISTAEKLLFLIVLIAGSIGAGYLGRRLGVGQRTARVLMYIVVTVPYTLVGFLSIWVLDFRIEFALLPVFGLAIMCAGLGGGAAFARALHMERRSAGAFVLVAGASNLGFTMGGFVNYALFGEQGLAIAAMYTMFWNVGMVLVLYPIARHYGYAGGEPLWKLIVANFWDIRSLPLLSVLTGLTLNLCGAPRPAFFGRALVFQLDSLGLLIIAGAILSFFTTGLRLHFAHLHLHRRLYVIVAGIKFILMPLVGAVLVGAMCLIGRPIPPPGWQVVLVQASTPAAIYAVVISNLFDLDDRLASIIFVVNTATYLVVVLPVLLFVFG